MSTEYDGFAQREFAVEEAKVLNYGRHSLGLVRNQSGISFHRCTGCTPCLHVTVYPPGSSPEMKWVQY